ncbi:MAG: hypothetical protein MJ252_31035 [archaeon]|nr:hypothetical protein [archaeon]
MKIKRWIVNEKIYQNNNFYDQKSNQIKCLVGKDKEEEVSGNRSIDIDTINKSKNFWEPKTSKKYSKKVSKTTNFNETRLIYNTYKDKLYNNKVCETFEQPGY